MNPISNISDPWYVIQCKLRREAFTARVLSNQLGLSIFLPESTIRLRGEVRQVPFFPGYLFAQADLQKVALSRINSSPGVLRLVEFGGCPQPVPYVVIETISKEVNRLNVGSHPPHHGFRPGDSVRVKNGPLQDLEMVFVGPTTPSKRVRVLLHLLGRLKEVQVDADTLEKTFGSTNIIKNGLHEEKRAEELAFSMCSTE